MVVLGIFVFVLLLFVVILNFFVVILCVFKRMFSLFVAVLLCKKLTGVKLDMGAVCCSGNISEEQKTNNNLLQNVLTEQNFRFSVAQKPHYLNHVVCSVYYHAGFLHQHVKLLLLFLDNIFFV